MPDPPQQRSEPGQGRGQEHPGELTRARRLLILVICSLSLLIVGLDVTIVNVALPAIHNSAPVRLGAAVDDRRLHADDRQPADVVGIHGGPDRTPAGVPDWA
jgi:hypothetical protein